MRSELPKRTPLGVRYRMVYAGLAAAIFAQVGSIALQIEWGTPWAAACNVTAIVVVGFCWWLIRQRQKGRL